MADIDFANADSRMKFLQEHLGTLMQGIDKNYGQTLMDELIRRLEKTVSEFNEEVKAMLGKLQAKEEAEFPEDSSDKPAIGIDLGSREGLSEFEKRLEALDE